MLSHVDNYTVDPRCSAWRRGPRGTLIQLNLEEGGAAYSRGTPI